MRRALATGCALGVVLLGTIVMASGQDRVASQYLAAGQRAFEEGDFTRAVDELKEAVAIKPTVKALLTLGNAYIKLGQLEDARAALARIVEIDPKSSKRKQVESLIHNLDTLAKTRLLVTSEPAGATVYLDMKADGPRGKTPATVPALPGKHRVMLELANHEPVTLPDIVAVEGQDVPVAATLRARGCDASFDAVPAARVSIDGGPAAASPVSARLIVGEHVVAFTLDGYLDKQRVVTCEADKPLVIKEALERVPYSALVLHAPAGARVSIDEQPVADFRRVQLAPGPHRVAVDAGAQGAWRAALTLNNGETMELTPTLVVSERAAPPRIDFAVSPRDASLLLDGAPVDARVPATVTPGNHVVLAMAPGHEAFGRHLQLARGDRLHFDARLQSRGDGAAYAGMAFTFLTMGAVGAWLGAHFAVPSSQQTWDTPFQWSMVGLASGFTFAAIVAYGSAAYLKQTPGKPSDASLYGK